MKLSTRDMILAALFTALTVLGAKINFLLPDIPITLQPLIVMLAGCILGSKTAFISQIVYIALGLMGIPVFAKPVAGPSYLLQSSFGFLLGFAAASYIIGLIVEKVRKKTLYTFVMANMAGLFIIYLFGVLYLYGLMNLYMGKHIGFVKAVTIGVLPFIVKDIILGFIISALAYNIYMRVKSQMRNA